MRKLFRRRTAGTWGLGAGEATVGPKPVQPIVLAVVTRAHGLKGEVSIHRFNPDSAVLGVGVRVWLEGRQVTGRWFKISGLRGDLLTLAEVSDRTQAELLRGAELSVERARLPAADPGEFYLHDLLGFEVVDAAGRRLGSLAGLQTCGTKEYFVIKGADDVLLPADAPIVAAVNPEAATVHLNVEVDPEDGPGGKGPQKGMT